MPPLQRNFMRGVHSDSVDLPLAPRARDLQQETPTLPSSGAALESTSMLTPPPTTMSSDGEGSHCVPLYTRTYVHRGVQTSPRLSFPDVVPHPHAYPYPLSYGYNQHIYWSMMPWNAPNTSQFPVPQDHAPAGIYNASEQRWRQNDPATTGAVLVPVMPLRPYPHHIARYPYARPGHQHSTSGQPTREVSPLIAPPPKVPLPPPESLSLASSEPFSPATRSSFHGTATSAGFLSALVTRRALSTPPLRSAASPVENPFHTLYKSLRSVLLISEPDPQFLAREISGDQLVSVHGVGIWSIRGTSPATLEIAKQHAFRAHASRATWLRAARARTAHYATPGAVRPPLRWVLIECGAALPADALQTGTEAGGAQLFSARAWWAGGLHVGKAAAHLQKGGASISYGSLEHTLTTYEVLVGDHHYATWLDVPADAVLAFPPENAHTPQGGAPTSNVSQDSHATTTIAKTSALPASFMPMEGGREAGGEALLIAQAAHARGWHPGKARLGDDHCCVGYGGGEVWVKTFRVLGYNI